MVSPEELDDVRRAEQIYEERLRAQLEKTHRDWFIAIEPASGDSFLGRSSYEAGMAARTAYPDWTSLVLRVGHAAAFEIMSPVLLEES